MSDDKIAKIFNESREYLSQRFTRDDKINLMLWEIYQVLNESFSRTIKLCSLAFHYNFEPESQEETLKYLQNTKKCIKYKVLSEKVPIDLVNCRCVEMPDFSEDDFAPHWNLRSRKVIEKAERAKYFEIEALGDFEKVAREICGLGGKHYRMRYDAARGNLSVNGEIIAHYSSSGQNAKVFEYLFSGEYKFGDTINYHDIVQTERKFAAFKYDTDIGKAIFGAFFSADGENFSFKPEVDADSLTPDDIKAIDNDITAAWNSNRLRQGFL